MNCCICIGIAVLVSVIVATIFPSLRRNTEISITSKYTAWGNSMELDTLNLLSSSMGNSNSRVSLKNTKGSVVRNSNTLISGSDSKVTLEGNSNSKVDLFNVDATIRYSSNGVVHWKNSPLNIQSNSNYVVSIKSLLKINF